ncbi:electron transfer flavoprotein subunit alpha/FixB family protein, partial [Streptomyces sp. CWNU-1]|nr:electron transfer flavoprotein subunit alpha/FixB family protein [Streptomyces sp. CWNU-1]
MADVLVYVDHLNGAVRKPTLELLTLARRLGNPIALALGPGATDTIPTLAEHGATHIYTHDAPEYTTHHTTPHLNALHTTYTQTQPTTVLITSTTDNKEIAARLALRTNSGLITDATDITPTKNGPTTTQTAFAASYTTHSHTTHGTPIITIKPNSTPIQTHPTTPQHTTLTPTTPTTPTTHITQNTPRTATGRPE